MLSGIDYGKWLLFCNVLLQAAAEDMYTVVQHAELAGFSVELCTSTSPIKTHCFITVTSALLRHSHDNNGNNATGGLPSVHLYCDTMHIYWPFLRTARM